MIRIRSTLNGRILILNLSKPNRSEPDPKPSHERPNVDPFHSVRSKPEPWSNLTGLVESADFAPVLNGRIRIRGSAEIGKERQFWIRNVFNFSVPFLSWLAFSVLALVTIILYFVPCR